MLDNEEDRDKFVRIYEKYRYFLWYLANERLQDPYLAEDAVQETFLALTRHMDKTAEVDSAATRNFLATIVKSKAIDLIRRRKGIRDEEFDESVLRDWQEDPLEAWLVQENYRQILKAVGELEEIYRVVSDSIYTDFYVPALSILIAVFSVFAVVFAAMLYARGRMKHENIIDSIRQESL